MGAEDRWPGNRDAIMARAVALDRGGADEATILATLAREFPHVPAPRDRYYFNAWQWGAARWPRGLPGGPAPARRIPADGPEPDEASLAGIRDLEALAACCAPHGIQVAADLSTGAVLCDPPARAGGPLWRACARLRVITQVLRDGDGDRRLADFARARDCQCAACGRYGTPAVGPDSAPWHEAPVPKRSGLRGDVRRLLCDRCRRKEEARGDG